MTPDLESLSRSYDDAEAAFLAEARQGASRSVLADRARSVAEAAARFNTEAYRKLDAGQEDAWMPLDNLTDVTETLSELWGELAEAFAS